MKAELLEETLNNIAEELNELYPECTDGLSKEMVNAANSYIDVEVINADHCGPWSIEVKALADNTVKHIMFHRGGVPEKYYWAEWGETNSILDNINAQDIKVDIGNDGSTATLLIESCKTW